MNILTAIITGLAQLGIASPLWDREIGRLDCLPRGALCETIGGSIGICCVGNCVPDRRVTDTSYCVSSYL